MAEKKSNCLLCGAEYDVCKLCRQVTEYTPWKVNYDSPRHFQIHAIVKDIRTGILTTEEAKARLDGLKVTPDEVRTFVPSVQKTLKPVMEFVKVAPKEEPKNILQAENKVMSPFKGRK